MRGAPTAEISVHSLLSLLQRDNLGEPHAIFVGGERYVSPRHVKEAERLLDQELRDAGYGDRNAYDDLLRSVGIMQRVGLEYYGWVAAADMTYAVLVGTSGRSAVVVVRGGDRVVFERVDPARMVETLVYRLPDVSAAASEPISVSAEDFGAPQRAAGSVMRRSAAARPEAARRLDHVLKAERRSVTKLYAAKRDADGTRRRSSRWLTVLDTVDGRWALTTNTVRGAQWIHAAPGSDRHIADALDGLARSVR